MDKSSLLTAFNNHFTEFIQDVRNVFPEDVEIATAETALTRLRKANPRLIIVIFKQYVVDRYSKQIYDGDLDYFISKDYSKDISIRGHTATILEKIDAIRLPIKEMTAENKGKVLKYLQNLCKLSELYNN